MLKFGMKSAVLGAATYYTVDAGVWRDCETTSVLYEDIHKKLEPYVGEVKNQIPYELPQLPGSDKVSYLTKYYWNTGVKNTFKFLVELPTHASNAAANSYSYISSALNQDDTLPKETEPPKK